MFRVILLQAAATALAVLFGGMVAGLRGGVSAALGGLACTIPNFGFALSLKFLSGHHRLLAATGFILGEFIKVVVTVALLWWIAEKYADLHWPFLLIGLAFALQAGFLTFWKKS